MKTLLTTISGAKGNSAPPNRGRSLRKNLHSTNGDFQTDGASLINGLADGDQDAAFAFCDKYGPRINRWVWRLLGADSDHDELVQQVYASVFTALPKLKDPDSLDAFVDSIAIRTVRKEIRRRTYRTKFLGSVNEWNDDVQSNCCGFKHAHIRAFYRIVNELNTDERMVIILKHIEGLTLEEIATIAGYSLRTAKRRLYSGTAKLREMMMKETVLVTMLEEY